MHKIETGTKRVTFRPRASMSFSERKVDNWMESIPGNLKGTLRWAKTVPLAEQALSYPKTRPARLAG
jgi:hypothetical protein